MSKGYLPRVCPRSIELVDECQPRNIVSAHLAVYSDALTLQGTFRMLTKSPASC
jgi:hypothetical protein